MILRLHESRTAEVLLDGAEGNAVIADKAYDSNAIRDTAKAAGMKAVIPSNRSRKRRIRPARKCDRREPVPALMQRGRQRVSSNPYVRRSISCIPLRWLGELIAWIGETSLL